jgi:hypothetical protein
MTTWTLEGELRKVAERDGILEALRALGLIGPVEPLGSVETIEAWHRSGDETYSLVFAVNTSTQRNVCVMKACTAYDGQHPLAEIFADWLSRRSLLAGLAVETPRLYGVGEALVIEEHIPYLLCDALQTTSHREALLGSIGATAARLVNAGFVPLRAHDWRSRGDDVVLVDFGQDLGPPELSHGSEAGLLSEVLDNVARAGVELSSDDLRRVGESYEQSLTG